MIPLLLSCDLLTFYRVYDMAHNHLSVTSVGLPLVLVLCHHIIRRRKNPTLTLFCGVGLLLAATLCMLLSRKNTESFSSRETLKVLMWREKDPNDDPDSNSSLGTGGETKAVLYPKRKRNGRAGTLMGDIVFP